MRVILAPDGSVPPCPKPALCLRLKGRKSAVGCAVHSSKAGAEKSPQAQASALIGGQAGLIVFLFPKYRCRVPVLSVLKNRETEAQKGHSSYLPRVMGSHVLSWHAADHPASLWPCRTLCTPHLLEATKVLGTSFSLMSSSVTKIQVFSIPPS